MKEVTFFIYSLGSGGAERVVSILLNKLNNKYKIKLVLMNEIIFYEIDKKVEIIFLDKENGSLGIKKFFKLPFLAYKYSKIKSNISISFLTRPNYINILSNLFKPSFTVISERSLVSEEFKKSNIHSKVSKFLIKSLYKYANLVISLSQGSKNDLIKNFNVSKIKVIYNPIDLKLIQKLSKEEINLSKKKFTFVTLGRLVEGKNQDLIIKAIKNLDANLWIIGDGERRKELEELVKELRLEKKVTFLGRQKNPFKFLKKADCFVYASERESFGNVLVEALACELPVISTDCPTGPREILALNNDFSKSTKDIKLAEYGILTPLFNVEKMAEAMKIIYENENLRKNYSKKAKIRVNDFSVEKIIKEWEKIIERDY